MNAVSKAFMGTLLVLVTVGSANATLLTNGGFDTNLSGWTIDPATTTGVTWDSGTAHLGRPGTPGVAIFEQSFDAPAGSALFDVSFDYEWQATKPALEDFFKVEIIYESLAGTVVEELLNQSSAPVTFNSPLSWSGMVALTDFNALASPNGTIRFTLTENNSPVGTRVQLDNVVVSAVPAPATLALLGLGLAAMGIGRVRR